MTPVLERNLGLLRTHRPALLAFIQGYLDQPFPGQVRQEANGLLNLYWPGAGGQRLNLHPANDPKAGCQQCVNILQGMEGRIIFFLGFGLGYEALAVCQAYSRLNQIKIIDPNPFFFAQALKYQDLQGIIANSNIDIHMGATLEELDSLVGKADTWHLLHGQPFLLSLKLACATDADWYRNADSRLQLLVNYKVVQSGSSIKNAKPMLANSFRNISSMVKGLPLDSLADKAKDKPAILVAAGPSLKKNIKLLKGMENSAVIIAVDTAIPKLMEHGISPHFVVAMDSRDRNADSFWEHWDALSDTALVYLNCSTPLIPKFFQNPKQYYVFDEAPVNQWFSRMGGQGTPMVSAASVALLGFYTAFILGCRPIIMIGLDLAYDPENPPRPDEADLCTVPGVDGRDVLSCPNFKNMIECFESLLRHLPGVFIDATEGGARIKYTSVMSLAEAMAPHGETMGSLELPVNRQTALVVGNSLQYLAHTATQLSLFIAVCRDVQSHAEKAQAFLCELEKQSRAPGAGPAIVSEVLAQNINLARQKHLSIIRGATDSGFADLAAILEPLAGKAQLDSHRKQVQWKKDHPEIVPGSVTANSLYGEMSSRLDLCQGMAEAAQWFINQIEVASRRLQLMLQGGVGPDATIEERLQQGEIYLESMDLEKALACFKSILADRPEHGRAHFGIGRIFMCRRDTENALRHFMTARSADQELTVAIDRILQVTSAEYLEVAKNRLRRGRPGADKYLKNILPQFPDYREAQELLAAL